MQGVDVGWVFAQEPRGHVGLERGLGGGDDGVAEAFTPPCDAGVGLHLDEQVIHGGEAQPGELLLWRAHVEREADEVGADGGDFH